MINEENICSRCGRCCIEFSHQIRFQEEEPFLQGKFNTEDPNILSRINYYFKIKDKFLQENKNKREFFIPTKGDLRRLESETHQTTSFKIIGSDKECMFLDWIQFQSEQENLDKNFSKMIPNCIIHSYNPKMCKEYPSSKGDVCLNHRERKYSKKFFDYQKQKIGFAIQTLAEIYKFSSINPLGYQILQLLMDFGNFNLDKVKLFFTEHFKKTNIEITESLSQLEENNLIFIRNNSISGISFNEINKKIDEIMISFKEKI